MPSGAFNGLELIVEFVRDSIVLPNVGRKWVDTWTPLLLKVGRYTIVCDRHPLTMLKHFDVS